MQSLGPGVSSFYTSCKVPCESRAFHELHTAAAVITLHLHPWGLWPSIFYGHLLTRAINFAVSILSVNRLLYGMLCQLFTEYVFFTKTSTGPDLQCGCFHAGAGKHFEDCYVGTTLTWAVPRARPLWLQSLGGRIQAR